jgi:predicted nucleotidyltransferase
MKLSEKRGALSATGVGSTLLHMSMLTNILAKLRAHESALRERGVLHVAVFGSVVRAENRDDSDVDLLVDLSPAVATDFFAYAGIAADLEAIVGQDVDVARRDRLRAHVRASAERDAVYAF